MDIAIVNTKLVRTLLGGALACGLSLTGVALARAHGPGCGAGKDAEFFSQADSNKDGKLDQNEWRAWKDKRHAQMIADFDQNNDGKLDERERQEMHVARAHERFKKLDTNSDGSVSADEAKAAGRFAHKFESMDQNRDGKVSADEFRKAALERAKRHAQRSHK